MYFVTTDIFRFNNAVFALFLMPSFIKRCREYVFLIKSSRRCIKKTEGRITGCAVMGWNDGCIKGRILRKPYRKKLLRISYMERFTLFCPEDRLKLFGIKEYDPVIVLYDPAAPGRAVPEVMARFAGLSFYLYLASLILFFTGYWLFVLLICNITEYFA